MKKLLFLFPLLLIGCASFHYRVVGWYNEDAEGSDQIVLNNGQTAHILGNPRITCFTNQGTVLADGIFVRVDGDWLIVDEFGTGYVFIKNNRGHYCTLWEQR